MPADTIRAIARLRVQSRLVSNPADSTGRKWRIPELRVSNMRLRTSGFEPGAFVLVTSPRPGVLVVMLDRDQRPTREYQDRRARRIARQPRRAVRSDFT